MVVQEVGYHSVIVDPANLEDGLHYYEVYGIGSDSNAPWRGPLFGIPVTLTKAMAVKNCPLVPTQFSLPLGFIGKLSIRKEDGTNSKLDKVIKVNAKAIKH
ncbi:tripeptidyl-peptidase 2-like [Silene latifolia]|uniref:tripeptidyl-peptidase 2-like n=1 Tax=Silene latifolia TaxID=37657 RepID=UPI003D76BD01